MHRRSAVSLAFVGAISVGIRTRADSGPDSLDVLPTGAVTSGAATPADSQLFPLSSVPDFHSDLGAPASLYLDFTGDTNSNWGGYVPGVTPAYDTDGDPSTFSSTELSNINQIFQRVAEKYSPFNIDVTTQKPADMSTRHTQEVVIGGSGSWFQLAGGVTFVGSFVNGPNISYVFSNNLAQSQHGVPKYVAEAIAHEAGHSFGLVHQSDWQIQNGNYVETAEYSLGNYILDPTKPGVQQPIEPGTTSPIMGESYFAERGLWWNGTAGTGTIGNSQSFPPANQDDMSIISSATNGFGYRPDDHGNTAATASPLTTGADGLYHAQGIIEQMTDKDYFSFSSTGGLVSFLVDGAPFGQMLDASAFLYDANGNLITESATSNLNELLSANVAPGTYDLVVSGTGAYGDVGQYFITGELGALVPEPSTLGTMLLCVFLATRRRAR